MRIKKEDISARKLENSIELSNLQTGQKIIINEYTYNIILEMIEEPLGCYDRDSSEKNLILNYLQEVNLVESDLNYNLPPIIKPDTLLSDSNTDSNIVFIGAPYDAGSTGTTGSKVAPEYFRRYFSGISNNYNNLFMENCEYPYRSNILGRVIDIGDILYLSGESIVDFQNRIKQVISLNSSSKILVLGGDHSISSSIVESLSTDFKQNIVFVKFDAHYDCSGTFRKLPLNHHNYIEKIREIERIDEIIHIGVREPKLPFYNVGDDKVFSDYDNFKRYFSSGEVKNVYISIDIDVLEPLINPGTSYQVPEGFEVSDILKYLDLLKSHNIIGADIVEYNPLLDKNNSSFYNVKKFFEKLVEIMEYSL
ncbi:TPA: arginase family protein [Streptococcus suis]|nr:arginase family protein [Streptococcus suis]HEM3724319.1 arginase family protein [Streptococcus suis]